MEWNERKTLKSKVVSGIIWRFGERFFAQIVTFIVTIVLARLLLPEDYGVVAIVTIFISLADVLVTNGLGTALIQKKEADETDFSTVFFCGIGISVLLYLIIFFTAPLISKIYTNELITVVLRVMGLRIPIAAINTVQQAFVVRNMLFKKFFYSTLFGTLVSGGVGIGMAMAGCGVWALVGQYLSNTVIDTFVLFLTISWKPKLLFSMKKCKGLFSYGWKIMASSFIGVLFNKAKNIVVGIKYDNATLAYYTKGESFPLLITTNIESTIDSVIFSALSKQQSNINEVRATCGKFLRLGSFIIIPFLVGMTVVADGMVKLLLTDKWMECVPFIQIVCFGQIFSLMSMVNLQAYKAISRSDVVLKLEFIKKPILMGIIIGMMFISPIAIALGIAAYELLGAIINSFMSKKLIGFGILDQIKEILPNLMIGLTMGVAVYAVKFIPIHYVAVLVIQIVLGVALYVGLSFAFNRKTVNYALDLLKKKKVAVEENANGQQTEPQALVADGTESESAEGRIGAEPSGNDAVCNNKESDTGQTGGDL